MAKTFIPNDPLFGAQWHLLNTGQDIMGLPQRTGAYRNDINVTSVWPDYTGEGVRIGIVDNGFQVSHPDLQQNFIDHLSYDFTTNAHGTGIGDHGTLVAGLAVAANNGVGGVGVAFDAEAIGYRNGLTIRAFTRAVAMMLQSDVDISSNSWQPNLGLFATWSDQKVFEADFINLVQLGRDGLGIVTLFAGANDREKGHNTNFEVVTKSPYAINVAAANSDGTVSNYSNPGASVLVAAPGSGDRASGPVEGRPTIVSSDLLGTAGYNKNPGGDYSNTLSNGSGFNGTSAATPIVAGIVALMLEANPQLGYRDVQEILAYSSRTPAEVASWNVNGASDWNGGGHLFNDDLGFGLVDAHGAIRLAETWVKQSKYENIDSVHVWLPEPEDSFSGFYELNPGEEKSISVRVGKDIRVQQALLGFSLQDQSVLKSNLEINLIGPDGHTASTLLTPAGYSLDWVKEFSFDSVQFWGMGSEGDWTLQVRNVGKASVEFMGDLTFIGDAVTPGETFIYTDDYARLGADDTDRTILSSTKTGPHTLNAAAVTSDTTVDLCCDEANIAGVTTYFTSDMRFARVVTGDGNDTLTGDEGDTVFFSGRGTNSVDGGGGHDTLQFLWDFKAYSQYGYGLQTVIVGADSLDYATDIAALQFADGTLTLGHDPLVNDLFYAGLLPELLNSGTTAESHYDTVGWKAGLDPNAVFDTSAYLANHAALKAAGTNPLDYFHETGWKNGDDPSARFDTSLYLKLNPDVAAAGVDPLQHYLQYGIHEGREVRPVVDSAHLQEGGGFDPTFYLLANEDVALAGSNPYEHWITYGQKEGRDPNAYFDVSYYLEANPDVAAAGSKPLEHYMTYGWKEGRDPSATFDTEGYLDHYADVAAAGIDPLVHYLVYGIGEGRQATWDLA